MFLNLEFLFFNLNDIEIFIVNLVIFLDKFIVKLIVIINLKLLILIKV